MLDDDEIMRKGRCGAFAEDADFELVDCGPTSRAREWPDRWQDVDVLVVAGFDAEAPYDRFVGVEVVQHARAVSGPKPEVFVIGLDGDNPYLEVRLVEAGADHLYRRAELRTIADLLHAVRRPDPARRPDGAASRRIEGLRGPTKVNEVLRRLSGLADAFEPGLLQSRSGLTRRQAINARHLVHEQARLDSATWNRTGGRQDRGFVPTWREVVDFVNRARGIELRSGGA